MNDAPDEFVDLSGRVLGQQFRLERLLGRGGMGEVYLAEQLEIGRHVVVKLLHPQLLQNAGIEERFKREARTLAQLNHPHIVQVLMFGRSDDGLLYLAMEYVAGRTLTRRLVESGPFTEKEALAILDQMCTALTEAHSLGIVHRDLKPDNVMITERTGQHLFVKVLDFGIAKLMQPTGAHLHLTQTGMMLGTPQYMAPEQFRAQPVDARTDIYALGLIGYELLSGQVPFKADNTADMMLRVLTEPATPLSQKMRGLALSSAAEALILKCLAKDPGDRFLSAAELQAAIGAVLHDKKAPPRQPLPPPSEPWPTAPATPTAEQNDSLRPIAVPPPAYEVTKKPWPMRSPFTVAGIAVTMLLGALWLQDRVDNKLEPLSTATDQDSEEPQIDGIPVPQGAEMQTITPQFVSVRMPQAPGEVLSFYRSRLRKSCGNPDDYGETLQFKNARAPIRAITVSRYGEGTQVSIARNPLIAPPPRKDRNIHGVHMPDGAIVTIETPLVAAFQAPLPIDEAIAFVRAQFTGKPNVSMLDAPNAGQPHLLITITDPRTRSAHHVRVSATMDALKPGPGVWSQVDIQ